LDTTKFKFLLPFARALDKPLHQNGNVFQPVAQAALSEKPQSVKKIAAESSLLDVRAQFAIGS
jgi:hypothetical protein